LQHPGIDLLRLAQAALLLQRHGIAQRLSEIWKAIRRCHRRRSHVTASCPSAIARHRWPPSLCPSIVVSLPLAPARRRFRPVVGVRAAKAAVAGNHFLHAHLEGWHAAIVMERIATNIRARAPRPLEGLPGAKVEQHCRGHGDYDENESHGSSPDTDVSGWCCLTAIWQLIRAERN